MKTLIETTPTGGEIYRASDGGFEAKPLNSAYYFPCTTLERARVVCDDPSERYSTDYVIGKRFHDVREEKRVDEDQENHNKA